MTRYLGIGLLPLSLLGAGCGAAPEAEQWIEPVESGGTSAGGTTGSAGLTTGSAGIVGASGGSGGTVSSVNPLGRTRCTAPEGTSASPQNTLETVQLLNALPKPTSVACFVESLARPLSVYATNSTFSAQPALGTKSPRVFIKLGQLWVSVVIDGESSYLVEFGDLLPGDPTRSIKGELELPLYVPVAASAPFDRVTYGQGTACGLCHYDERPADNMPFPGAFASIAFRPRDDTRVSIDSLRIEHQSCDWHSERHRCEMLSAVFEGGTVEEEPFPNSMPTFY